MIPIPAQACLAAREYYRSRYADMNVSLSCDVNIDKYTGRYILLGGSPTLDGALCTSALGFVW